MSQDQQLKSLFATFDHIIEEKPPVLQDQRLHQQIHRYRSPWAKFLVWVINGGAAMFVVFGLVSLSGIFWNGMSFGWVLVPAVILLMRPFMGDTPIKRPGRMALILLLGVFLSISLSVGIDFMVNWPSSTEDPYLFCFLLENSLLALLLPEYSLTIITLVVGLIGVSRWVAGRYPWLERSAPLKSWRVYLSVIALTFMVSLSGFIAYRAEYRPAWLLVREFRHHPEMEKVVHGANLPAGKEVPGLSNDDSAARAGELAAKLREKPTEVTVVELKTAQRILENPDGKTDDLRYVDLWWELNCFAQDYCVGREIGHIPTLMEGLPLRIFLSSDLDLDAARLWYTKLEGRKMRTSWIQSDLKKIVVASVYKEREQALEERGLARFKAGVADRYCLQDMLGGYGRLPYVNDIPLLGSRVLRKRNSDYKDEVSRRFRGDMKRCVLHGILEARLYRAEHGEYPDQLQTPLPGYEYRKNDASAEIVRVTWDGKEVYVCRLPR